MKIVMNCDDDDDDDDDDDTTQHVVELKGHCDCRGGV